MALSTFADALRGRQVVIHCDNTGAERALSRGTCKAWDHAQLIQAMWSDILVNSIDVNVLRVASAWNIADLPTRMQDAHTAKKVKNLFAEAGVREVQPALSEMYFQPETWFEMKDRSNAAQ